MFPGHLGEMIDLEVSLFFRKRFFRQARFDVRTNDLTEGILFDQFVKIDDKTQMNPGERLPLKNVIVQTRFRANVILREGLNGQRAVVRSIVIVEISKVGEDVIQRAQVMQKIVVGQTEKEILQLLAFVRVQRRLFHSRSNVVDQRGVLAVQFELIIETTEILRVDQRQTTDHVSQRQFDFFVVVDQIFALPVLIVDRQGVGDQLVADHARIETEQMFETNRLDGNLSRRLPLVQILMQNLSMEEVKDVVLQFADRSQAGGEKNSALIFRRVQQKHRQFLVLGEIVFLAGQLEFRRLTAVPNLVQGQFVPSVEKVVVQFQHRLAVLPVRQIILNRQFRGVVAFDSMVEFVDQIVRERDDRMEILDVRVIFQTFHQERRDGIFRLRRFDRLQANVTFVDGILRVEIRLVEKRQQRISRLVHDHFVDQLLERRLFVLLLNPLGVEVLVLRHLVDDRLNVRKEKFFLDGFFKLNQFFVRVQNRSQRKIFVRQMIEKFVEPEIILFSFAQLFVQKFEITFDVLAEKRWTRPRQIVQEVKFVGEEQRRVREKMHETIGNRSIEVFGFLGDVTVLRQQNVMVAEARSLLIFVQVSIDEGETFFDRPLNLRRISLDQNAVGRRADLRPTHRTVTSVDGNAAVDEIERVQTVFRTLKDEFARLMDLIQIEPFLHFASNENHLPHDRIVGQQTGQTDGILKVIDVIRGHLHFLVEEQRTARGAKHGEEVQQDQPVIDLVDFHLWIQGKIGRVVEIRAEQNEKSEAERLKRLLKFFVQIVANPLEVRRWRRRLVACGESRVEMNEPDEKAVGRSRLRSTLVDQRSQRLDRRPLAQNLIDTTKFVLMFEERRRQNEFPSNFLRFSAGRHDDERFDPGQRSVRHHSSQLLEGKISHLTQLFDDEQFDRRAQRRVVATETLVQLVQFGRRGVFRQDHRVAVRVEFQPGDRTDEPNARSFLHVLQIVQGFDEGRQVFFDDLDRISAAEHQSHVQTRDEEMCQRAGRIVEFVETSVIFHQVRSAWRWTKLKARRPREFDLGGPRASTPSRNFVRCNRRSSRRIARADSSSR